jgi:hypothetical protein
VTAGDEMADDAIPTLPVAWQGAARTGVAPFAFPADTRPWNWLELDKASANDLWRILAEFVAYFNARYGERPELCIPPCWAEHGPVVEELTTLWWARWQAFESAHASIGGAQYWHTYSVPGFFERITRWLGADRLERCRQGLHEGRAEEAPEGGANRKRAREEIRVLDLAERDDRAAPAKPIDPNAQQLPIPFLDRG